ncbi:MAG: NYN domain-containing protein, partial [Thermoplasmataceae archaeon]
MNQFERVMIFIDGSNVFRSIQNFNHETGKNFRIDYLKLVDYLCNERNLIRPYYYGSEDAESTFVHVIYYIGGRKHDFSFYTNIDVNENNVRDLAETYR